jgi:predicted AlkP superfamily pyrophosphatase or phosphodiesterase
MRRFLLVLALVLAAAAPRPQAQSTPKLVVMLAIDQMRADYLEVFKRHWQGGFRTLLSEGLVFDNAHYPYLNTITCAGHSTIGTGTNPRTHGMFLNTWWDRTERRTVECTADAKATDISYGKPVKAGNSGSRMLVPTLADEMRTQKPGARVVGLSLKARSAIGLVGHGGDAVVWFDDPVGTFATSSAYAPGPVAAVKAFIDRNPYEKDLGRVWNLLGPPGSYVRRDAGVGERPPAGWTGLFPHLIAGRDGKLDAQFSALWQATPLADAYMARMAAALVDSFALGQRATTDFLGISFSTLDDVGHGFGPDSREIEDILRHLDGTLGTLIQHLDARVGRANYVLALSADHGVAPHAGYGRGGRINAEDLRERIQETLTTQFGPLEKGSYVDAVSFTSIYLAPGVYDRLTAHPAALAAVTRNVEEIPGVARLLRSDQMSDRSSDPVVRAAALSHVAGRSGELVVISKEFWYISTRAVAGTTHGSLHEYDTHVPVIFLGGAVKPGRSRTAITPADIAPTLGQMVGVTLPKADGRALREALR